MNGWKSISQAVVWWYKNHGRLTHSPKAPQGSLTLQMLTIKPCLCLSHAMWRDATDVMDCLQDRPSNKILKCQAGQWHEPAASPPVLKLSPFELAVLQDPPASSILGITVMQEASMWSNPC